MEATSQLFTDETTVRSDDSEDEDRKTDSKGDDPADEEPRSETASSTSRAMSSGNHDSPSLAKPYARKFRLPLKYLVSNLSIFDVTTAHDAVYALLAVAQKTVPTGAGNADYRRRRPSTQKALDDFTHTKGYTVDYRQPFADIAKDFVAFCIASSTDRTRALDIICRPWAPVVDGK